MWYISEMNDIYEVVFYFSSRRVVMLIRIQERRNQPEKKSFRTLTMPHQ
jgi:hypothetical protein